MVQENAKEVQTGVHKENKKRHFNKSEFSKAFTTLVRAYQRKSGLSVNDFAKHMNLSRSSTYGLLSGNRGDQISYVVSILDRIGYDLKVEFIKKETP